MKFAKIFFYCLMLCSFVFTGCEDDSAQEDSIVGTWKVVSLDYVTVNDITGTLAYGEPFSQSTTTIGELIDGELFMELTDNSYASTGNYIIEARGTTVSSFETETIDQTVTVSIDDLDSLGDLARNGDEITFIGTFIDFGLSDIDFEFGDLPEGFPEDFNDQFDDVFDDYFDDIDFGELTGDSQTESTMTIAELTEASMTLTFSDSFNTSSDGSVSNLTMSQTIVLQKQ